jgi:hypothetical protein
MDEFLVTIQGILSATPERWIALARGIPDSLFSRVPAPGEWSAQECLQHLVDTEEFVFPVRVHAFLAGEDFPGFNPEKDGSAAGQVSGVALAEKFARLRAVSLAAVGKITPADLANRARHAELGMVTLGEMLNEWAAHDFNHTIQAERALMQPFIQDCGPWQFYFSDHVVKAK